MFCWLRDETEGGDLHVWKRSRDAPDDSNLGEVLEALSHPVGRDMLLPELDSRVLDDRPERLERGGKLVKCGYPGAQGWPALEMVVYHARQVVFVGVGPGDNAKLETVVRNWSEHKTCRDQLLLASDRSNV